MRLRRAVDVAGSHLGGGRTGRFILLCAVAVDRCHGRSRIPAAWATRLFQLWTQVTMYRYFVPPLLRSCGVLCYMACCSIGASDRSTRRSSSSGQRRRRRKRQRQRRTYIDRYVRIICV